MKPGKWKRSAMPRRAASSIIASIMSPEPAKQKRMLRVRLSTRAAASTKYSGPFCMVMRPKKVTTFSLRSAAGRRSATIWRMSSGRG